MVEERDAGGSRRVPLVRDLAPGFEMTHQDPLFDEFLDEFFESGTFPHVSDTEISLESSETQERIARLKRLEQGPDRRYCTELRNAITRDFNGDARKLLLKAMKYMLRVHIDDANRSDTGLPGVSHQIKVALRVHGILQSYNRIYRHNANILAAAMFHDIVEDHQRLLLLEQREIGRLRKTFHADGTKFIPDDAPPRTQVITLLEAAGGLRGRPNRILGGLLRAVTLDRSKLLETWDGLSREEAFQEEQKLEEKDGTAEEKQTRTLKKNELYWPFVFDPMTGRKFIDAAASLIKLCDLEDNALAIGMIKKKYLELSARDEPPKEELEQLRSRFNKFQAKYRLVLEDTERLLGTWPRDTWVGSIAEEMRAKIHTVLKEDYEAPL